jgi:hypothetical protein
LLRAVSNQAEASDARLVARMASPDIVEETAIDLEKLPSTDPTTPRPP